MKRILLVLFVGIALSANAQLELKIIKTGTDGGVDVSFDDGEYENDSIDKLFDDDLDMGWEGEDLNIMTTFLRFQNAEIAKGKKIDSAFLCIYAHEDESDEAKITIYAEAADNSAAFTETGDIDDRSKTTATVKWNITQDWTMWEPYRSPNIASVLQEVVNRSGWKSGNALTLFLKGEDQGASLLDNARDFESFENIEDPEDGGDGLHHPERIPVLKIYLEGAPIAIDFPLQVKKAIAYPNPVSSTLYLTLGSEEAQISIYSESGKLVYSSISMGTNPQIDLSGINSGLYILEVIQNGIKKTEKIIIK